MEFIKVGDDKKEVDGEIHLTRKQFLKIAPYLETLVISQDVCKKLDDEINELQRKLKMEAKKSEYLVLLNADKLIEMFPQIKNDGEWGYDKENQRLVKEHQSGDKGYMFRFPFPFGDND